VTFGWLPLLLAANHATAFTLDDIQFWAGAGTNRAAMVIQWNPPEVRNHSNVLAPVTSKTLVWGYRWNGTASAEDMFNAILAADRRLFAAVNGDAASGKAVLALGYDLNDNRLFGLRDGTNILAFSPLANAPSAFTNGLAVLGYGDADMFQSLDSVDLYWGGWLGPNWELWREQGGDGGFTNAPDRGGEAYWTPDDPDMPFTGHDGQWLYVGGGMSGLALKDGSWIGHAIAAGGLDFGSPDDPGTIAWGLRKQAPAALQAAPTNQSPYAVELAASHGPFGPSLYNDPMSVLGEPTSLAVNFDPVVGNAPFHITLVEPAYNRDVDGQKVIVTLNRSSTNGGYVYGSVTAKFDHPITDDPANPYGVDFEVFGNTFYVGGGYVGDKSDMRTYNLVGGAFAEPMRVSVSPDGVNWYTYTNGPFCDATFPTHGYEWDADQFDATGNGWTKKRMDFTKPVNPVLDSFLGAPGVTLPAADAIRLYAGSGGGTGFDLAESGFGSIQYIRVEGADGYYAGEVDAFSDVRPAMLGESLVIAPENLANGTETLSFQDPGNPAVAALQISFREVNEIALVATGRIQESNALAALPGSLVAGVTAGVTPMLAGEPLQFSSDIAFNIGARYRADGSDLDAVSWDGTNWSRRAFAFDSGSRVIALSGVTNSITLAVIQIALPSLAISPYAGGFKFQFVPVAGWTHALERSSDFRIWSVVDETTPETSERAMLVDQSPPAGRAFYRLRLRRP
jgi:hypothetical protein